MTDNMRNNSTRSKKPQNSGTTHKTPNSRLQTENSGQEASDSKKRQHTANSCHKSPDSRQQTPDARLTQEIIVRYIINRPGVAGAVLQKKL